MIYAMPFVLWLHSVTIWDRWEREPVGVERVKVLLQGDLGRYLGHRLPPPLGAGLPSETLDYFKVHPLPLTPSPFQTAIFLIDHKRRCFHDNGGGESE
ncbi:hypothetical protein CDAR_485691 [Caerostris darwini]|uniref:Uncharacterized protein n=1 Tax=Caerostris darwini TaxID=1538125 RepID=A0AAV4WLB2_9ARAC|nr:hypothetical protein CDAR_485691 [Caerostris darwini]